MRYFGTGFSLTLGAWRLRISIDLEDAPDDSAVPSLRQQANDARRGSATSR
jgi:hypothetical protein